MATKRVALTPPQSTAIVNVPEDQVERYRKMGFREAPVAGGSTAGTEATAAPNPDSPKNKADYFALAAQLGLNVEPKTKLADLKKIIAAHQADAKDETGDSADDSADDDK